MENNNEINKKVLIILIAIFTVIVLGLGGWMIYDKTTNKKPDEPVEKPEEVVQKYDLYNKIEKGLLVSVNSDNKNILNYYVACDNSCDEYDMSKIYVNEQKELIMIDDGGNKYKLSDNVKSVNSYKPDDNHLEYDEIVVYETTDGEKYLLTDENEEEKLAAINVKNLYGYTYVDGIYLINDASIAENVAKYNGNIINAKNVYYGVSFNFNSSFMDESATANYVVTTDNKVLYTEISDDGVWKDTNVKANQLTYDKENNGIRFKAKYTEIFVHITY